MSYAFNNENMFNMGSDNSNVVDIKDLIVSTPVIVSVISFISLIIICVTFTDTKVLQGSFTYQEFQGS